MLLRQGCTHHLLRQYGHCPAAQALLCVLLADELLLLLPTLLQLLPTLLQLLLQLAAPCLCW
jgi:hypothetical protein